MEKQRAAFPRPANRITHSSINKPVIHISTNADYGVTLIYLFYIIFNEKHQKYNDKHSIM